MTHTQERVGKFALAWMCIAVYVACAFMWPIVVGFGTIAVVMYCGISMAIWDSTS